jgi:two-component system, OmpR family, sensor histidine kinase CiaH
MKRKKLKFVFFIFWSLLAYTLAALIWWFIELNHLNIEMRKAELGEISISDAAYQKKYDTIIDVTNRNTIQFLSEGIAFLILIISGAIFIYRGFIRELKDTKEQQNFMMAITHELKTPVAVAKLNLETMQKHSLTESQQKRIITNTLQETNRLDILCNNLLVSSQIESKNYNIVKTELQFSELLHDCVANFKLRYPERSISETIVADINVLGDFFLLQIAVNNLIENAIKYSPKEKPIEIELIMEKNMAILKVIDEGAGVQDGEKKLVFEKFYRTGSEATRRAKGTGLGLYLISKICKTHHGDIKIVDNPKGGSIFMIRLKASF